MWCTVHVRCSNHCSQRKYMQNKKKVVLLNAFRSNSRKKTFWQSLNWEWKGARWIYYYIYLCYICVLEKGDICLCIYTQTYPFCFLYIYAGNLIWLWYATRAVRNSLEKFNLNFCCLLMFLCMELCGEYMCVVWFTLIHLWQWALFLYIRSIYTLYICIRRSIKQTFFSCVLENIFSHSLIILY